MKANADLPEWLLAEIQRQAMAIAAEHEIPLHHLLSTSHKTTRIAEARSELVGWIREQVVCLCDRHGAAIDFALRANVARGCTISWFKPSYPVIGKMLGMDHSAALLLHRRWKSRMERTEKTGTKG